VGRKEMEFRNFDFGFEAGWGYGLKESVNSVQNLYLYFCSNIKY
jgi:hypothetical protein